MPPGKCERQTVESRVLTRRRRTNREREGLLGIGLCISVDGDQKHNRYRNGGCGWLLGHHIHNMTRDIIHKFRIQSRICGSVNGINSTLNPRGLQPLLLRLPFLLAPYLWTSPRGILLFSRLHVHLANDFTGALLSYTSSVQLIEMWWYYGLLRLIVVVTFNNRE